MATTYGIKIKTSDSNDKSYTKNFNDITTAPSAANVKGFANLYAALQDYSTKNAQKITYEDVDLSE